jgi:hypothetical protein
MIQSKTSGRFTGAGVYLASEIKPCASAALLFLADTRLISALANFHFSGAQ